MDAMTYYDSAEAITISRRRAILELEMHGVTEEDLEIFFDEEGDSDEYDAQQVLRWLGY